jgi:hypothetical protein
MKVAEQLEKVTAIDKNFTGTVAFRSEEITLPNRSKMALGIDDGHWVLIYQKEAGNAFKVYKYNQHDKQILVDQKAGGSEDFRDFRRHIEYFFSNARQEDLVTLLPPTPEV